MQSEFAGLLNEYLDPAVTFATGLENKPLSPLGGYLQKQRGVRSGLPDVLVLHGGNWCGGNWSGINVVAVELKSPRGVLSKVQRQIAAELEAVGTKCWMARTARAALTALYHSRVPFRFPWTPPRLEAWEGPFPASARGLPQHPHVAAERRAARKRWQERQRARAAFAAVQTAPEAPPATGDAA